MELAVLTVVVLVCSAVAGDASLQGQWISQDSVFNGQNIFQIQQGSLFFHLLMLRVTLSPELIISSGQTDSQFIVRNSYMAGLMRAECMFHE